MERLFFAAGATACVVGSFLACSATPGTGGSGAGGAGGAPMSSTSTGLTATSTSSSAGVGGFTSSSDGAGGAGGGCVATSSKAMPVPLDLFIMLDQSGSMLDDAGNAKSRWQTVKAAITSFVGEPSAAGIGVGLQYFGLPDPLVPGCPSIPCAMDADCTGGCTICGPGGVCHGPYNPDIDTCDPLEYAWAEVPIAVLPGAAPAIISSLGMHAPGTNTPTAPALAGAIDYAKAWTTAHPGHITAVAFATDGLPGECDLVQGHINMIAADGVAGAPSIKTYVIGVGPALQELDDIAAAGGTTAAFHVDVSPMAEQAFLDAMNTIRGAAIGCTYQIPAPPQGMILDPQLVNVRYTPGNGGAERTIPKVTGKAQCPAQGDGWYYDNDANPTQIILCDATCSVVAPDVMGEVDILFGCKAIVK